MKTVWESVVFQLIVDTVVLAEMKEAESDIYTLDFQDHSSFDSEY